MSRFFLILVLAISSFISCQVQNEIKTVKNERIVSLSPNITEIIFALNQQHKLIAVSEYCTYPAEANQIERIGGLLDPNMERLLSLNADLFIGTPAHQELAHKLRTANKHTVLLPNDQLADVFSSIDSIGSLLGCNAEAQQLMASIQDSLAHYKTLASELKSSSRALLVIGRDPGGTHKITASGTETFLSEVWQLLGAQNTFSNLPARYAQISREALLINNPELIIEFKFKQDWNEKKDFENKKSWADLITLSAVKRDRIFVLTGDYTLIPGPRIYLLARDYYNILVRNQAIQ